MNNFVHNSAVYLNRNLTQNLLSYAGLQYTTNIVMLQHGTLYFPCQTACLKVHCRKCHLIKYILHLLFRQALTLETFFFHWIPRTSIEQMLQTLKENSLQDNGLQIHACKHFKNSGKLYTLGFFFTDLQVLKASDTFYSRISVLDIILFFTERKISPDQQIQNINFMYPSSQLLTSTSVEFYCSHRDDAQLCLC